MSTYRNDGYCLLPMDEDKPTTIFDYSSPFVYEDSNKQFRSIFTYHQTRLTSETENSFDDDEVTLIHRICKYILILLSYIAVVFTAPISLYFVIKRIPKHERLLVFRLGRIQPLKGPGTVHILPCIDRSQRLDLRMKAFIIPPQQFITDDGAVVEMGAEMQYRIVDGRRTALNVQDLDNSIRIMGRSVLVNRLCRKTVAQLEKERVDISRELRENMDQSVLNWGLEIGEIELSLVNVLRASEPRTAINQLVSTLQNALNPSKPTSSPNQIPCQHFNQPSYIHQRLQEVMKIAEESGQLPHIRATFQLEITGHNGGCFFITIDNGHCQVSSGLFPSPDVFIAISEEDFDGIFSSEVTPLQAYISGRLKINGDTQLLMTLDAALQAVKKNSKSSVLTV